jgi:hypothetical protein
VTSVSDVPENLETVGDAGVTFRSMDVRDLRDKLSWLLSKPAAVENYRESTRQSCRALFLGHRCGTNRETIFFID